MEKGGKWRRIARPFLCNRSMTLKFIETDDDNNDFSMAVQSLRPYVTPELDGLIDCYPISVAFCLELCPVQLA